MSNKLPKGWVNTTLGEVCLAVDTVQPQATPDAEFTYFDIGGIDNQSQRIAETKTVTGREAPSRARQLIRTGDILFSTVRTYLKKIARIESDYPNPVASTGFSVIRAAEGVSSQFLFFRVLSEDFLQPLHALQTGSTYPAVRDKDVFTQPIPLPPSREQERIVVKLDALLSRITAGEAALRRAQERLKRYRVAVLHSAVTGELTRDWRKIHKPTETGAQLLKRLLRERRTCWEETELKGRLDICKPPKDNRWKERYPEPVVPDSTVNFESPNSWAMASLDQCFQVERGKFSVRPRNDPAYYDGPHPFVQIGNLPREGGLVTEYTQTLNDKGLNVSKKFPRGTILIAIVGATIANTGVLGFDACCPDSLVAVRSDDETLRCYGDIWLRANKLKLRGSAIASGGQPNINLGIILPFFIALPPLAEQAEIIREVERRLAAAERLLATVNRQLDRIRVARQSLLNEAFTGNFVQQDPSEESASILLGRIRAMRESEDKKPKAKRMPKPNTKTSRRPLLEVLRERKKPMSSEALFRESGCEAQFNESDEPQEVVDSFYKELRRLTEKPAKVAQQKDSKHQILLKALP
ncbi:MAG: hypothetical protein EOP84_01815 [Verrucomicrobiaceae bacterium]|nr:MAG: hypothetical protein EOP84_01815 [Verrucomicrobiaceae bacterium]